MALAVAQTAVRMLTSEESLVRLDGETDIGYIYVCSEYGGC